MKRPRSTSRNGIRGPVIRLGLALAIAAAAIYFAYDWRTRQTQAMQEAEARLADAEQRAATAIRDRADLAAYQSGYEELRRRHFIGLEARLPWAEHFTALVENGNPLAISMTIDKQRLFEWPIQQPLGEQQLFASRLNLEANLSHDGDFYRLLAGLWQVTGAHILRSCTLLRNEQVASDDGGRIKLKCTFDLMTLDKPPAPAEAAPQ